MFHVKQATQKTINGCKKKVSKNRRVRTIGESCCRRLKIGNNYIQKHLKKTVLPRSESQNLGHIFPIFREKKFHHFGREKQGKKRIKRSDFYLISLYCGSTLWVINKLSPEQSTFPQNRKRRPERRRIIKIMAEGRNIERSAAQTNQSEAINCANYKTCVEIDIDRGNADPIANGKVASRRDTNASHRPRKCAPKNDRCRRKNLQECASALPITRGETPQGAR